MDVLCPGLKVMIKKNSTVEISSKYHVPNLERALLIIELLADHSAALSISQISELLSIPRNSVYRIASTLLNTGYLSKSDTGNKYRLTRKLLAVGCSAMSDHSIVEHSLPVMRRLRDIVKETVLIGTIACNEGVVIEQISGKYPFRFTADIGARMPLHASAPTKAILAFIPKDERSEIISQIQFTRFNSRTISSLKELCKTLEDVRKNGYAVDHSEELEGVNCVGAPVFNKNGYPVAAIWTTGPSDRLSDQMFEIVGQQIKEHAMEISRSIGFVDQPAICCRKGVI
jgi:DNA-binding IclR family transcriptional regulator